jgi:HEPN domain-containing protein
MSEEIPYDAVCFHCQQAAEKLLKAYLVGKGQLHPITHDLFLILEKTLPLNSDAEKLRDALSILMPYAVENSL